MKYISLLLFILSLNAWACEYLGKDGLLITKKEILAHDLALKLKNCNETEQEVLRTTLSNLEGNISAFQLEHLLNLPNFKLNHERLIIKNLNKITRQQLALQENIQVRSTHNSPSFIDFNSGDRLSIFCNGCLYGAKQNLILTTRSLLGQVKQQNIEVDFITYFKAYRLLTNTSAFSTINPDQLELIQTEKIPHAELITDTDKLRFYRTNKPLKAGELLKMSDFSANKIIQAGVKSELILENHFVKIKTQGIPRSAASIGEMVEVYHPEKKKKYYGKVIDINKVHVEL